MLKKPIILFVTDIPFWGGSTLSLKDLLCSLGNKITPIVIVYEEGEVSHFMKANGIKCYVVPYGLNTLKRNNKVLNILYNTKTIIKYYISLSKGVKAVRNIHKLEKIDIIHSNTSAFDFGYIAAKSINVKHIWHIREMLESFHGISYIGGFPKLKREMKKSDRLIFISNACASYWGMNTFPNMIVIGDAVRKKSDVFYKKQKKSYFLFCAFCLSDFKGCDIALRAFGMSKLSRIGYRLKLIGYCSDEYKKKLSTICNYFDIADNVDYLGNVDNKSVKDYMSEASAFLQCGEMEGLGRTAIEAMFYGCPVIARNCGGTTDFIEHYKTGFLWNNEIECSEWMNIVVKEDMESIILNAHDVVREKYSIEKYGERMMAIYRSLVK